MQAIRESSAEKKPELSSLKEEGKKTKTNKQLVSDTVSFKENNIQYCIIISAVSKTQLYAVSFFFWSFDSTLLKF
jgi:hypothetical protein